MTVQRRSANNEKRKWYKLAPHIPNISETEYRPLTGIKIITK